VKIDLKKVWNSPLEYCWAMVKQCKYAYRDCDKRLWCHISGMQRNDCTVFKVERPEKDNRQLDLFTT
jgi:hypothetical protein